MTQRIAFYKKWIFFFFLALNTQAFSAFAAPTEQEVYDQGLAKFNSGQYLSASSAFFGVYVVQGKYSSRALGRLVESLIKAGYPNSAAYFFIKALQSENSETKSRVLEYLPSMLDSTGVEVLRPYVLKYTKDGDYTLKNRSYFYYLLAKDELLKGDHKGALVTLSRIPMGSYLDPQVSYLKGAAFAINDQVESAIKSFETCRKTASKAEGRVGFSAAEAEDLKYRCIAGLGRAYYQRNQFDKAEELYDEIPKSTYVFTDILFEQAWNGYSKGDFNRALGKLVNYRSPSLRFVFNPEIEVLRAQSFLALCYYDDAAKSLTEFMRKYSPVGVQIKEFLTSHESDLTSYYDIATKALRQKLHTDDMLMRAVNRFARSPYIAGQMYQERYVLAEMKAITSFANERGLKIFSGFMTKALQWRLKSVRLVGGAFIKNSMADLYEELLSNLDKASFIKLEMLKRSRSQYERRSAMTEDDDGVLKKGRVAIDRKDYQYFWSFNGEFWVDELGDYVFALESQCEG